MKKVIALVLAIIMTLSIGVVAFAADEAPAEPATKVEETTEEQFNPMDLPVWLIPVALKVGKIALKIAKVFVKIATIFGIIDSGDLVEKITSFIEGLQKPDTTPETATKVVAA